MNTRKLIGSFNFKKRIEALRKRLSELKLCRAEAEEERRLHAMKPAFFQICGSAASIELDKFFPCDFMARVADRGAQYGDVKDAAKELDKLIAAEG